MANLTKQSKFLSLILRHNPEVVGVTLDSRGWVDFDVLLKAIQRTRPSFSIEILNKIVETNDKKRFAFSEDGKRIRASQGHSIGIDLNLEPSAPPEILFHGTADRNLNSIREQGLLSGARDHVHLSAEEITAHKVGMRHGKPVVLRILAGAMAENGKTFYFSENGVWLTDFVPVDFIEFPT